MGPELTKDAVIVDGLTVSYGPAVVLDRIGLRVPIGSALAVLMAVAAVTAQRRPAWGRVADAVAGTAAGAALVIAIGSQELGWSVTGPVDPGAVGLGPAMAAAAVGVGVIFLVYARLDGWPTHRIVEASAIAGAYADVLYAVEPSFLADLSSRRFWQRRGGFSATRLFRRGRLPPVLVHDLLIARRKAGRLWWLVAAAAVPTALAAAPIWVTLSAVLLGALATAGTLTESTHIDAGNQAMLRLLGRSGRQVMAQRLIVPGLLAGAWLALALGGLQAAGRVNGALWVLGLAAGPAVAVAALRRARVSAASVGNVLVDTPMGAFPSGMLLWLTNGVDVLVLLTLPVSIGLFATSALGWSGVLLQLAASGAGAALLLRFSATHAGRLR